MFNDKELLNANAINRQWLFSARWIFLAYCRSSIILFLQTSESITSQILDLWKSCCTIRNASNVDIEKEIHRINIIVISIYMYWSLTWKSFEGNNSNDIWSFNHYYLCLKWSTSFIGHRHLASNRKVIQWTFDIMLFPYCLRPSYLNEYAVCQLTYHGLVSHSVELRNMTWPGFNLLFWKHCYLWGPKFMVYQNFVGLWGLNFVGN